MAQRNPATRFGKSRIQIATRVRELRSERGWTQATLARQLEISQSRLSEIEKGAGSFTAEQFLQILQLFNVDVTHFVQPHDDRELEVQSALARLGATQLQESERVLPSKQLAEVHAVLREALVLGTPRLVTAVSAVLLANLARLNLPKLYADLDQLGYGRRLAWVVDNTLLALHLLAKQHPSIRDWRTLLRRAELPFSSLLEAAGRSVPAASHQAPPDILDATIRSQRTLEDVQRDASEASVRWNIATSLQPTDFAKAIEAARAH